MADTDDAAPIEGQRLTGWSVLRGGDDGRTAQSGGPAAGPRAVGDNRMNTARLAGRAVFICPAEAVAA